MEVELGLEVINKMFQLELVFDDLSGIKTALQKDLGAYDEKLYGDGNARYEIIESLKKYM